MADDKNGVPLDEDQLNALVDHLKQEEEAARESRLSSVESLRQWMLEHPMLSHVANSANFAQYAPALLQMLQRVFGI